MLQLPKSFLFTHHLDAILALFRIDLFWTTHGYEGGGEVRRKASSFRSKICLTIIKVSTVIPYLIKIQIRHISSETPLSSADQYFFTRNYLFLLHREITLKIPLYETNCDSIKSY